MARGIAANLCCARGPICTQPGTGVASKWMEAAQNLCHRCSSPLPEQALFCTQCGSPQLVLTETDAQRIADERAATPDGSTPQPRVSPAGRIRWRPALRIVAAIAVTAGGAVGLAMIVPSLGFVGTLLFFMGPLFAISLYQRRVPGAPMGAGVGARIGAVLGLLMTLALAAVVLSFILIYRYPLHHSAQMDQKFNAYLQMNMAQSTAMYPSLYPNPAQTLQVLQFIQSPNGHAEMALVMAGFLCASMLAYSVLFGAFWGWLRPLLARQRPA